MSKSSEYASFWEHLDELRSRLIRMLILLALFTIIAFLLKEQLFNVVLAPRDSNFVTYRLMGVSAFSIQLINTGLTEQFMVHMRTAMFTGLLAASPYIIYELFRFVSPGLYDNERRYAFWLVGSAYVMFAIGLLLNYFLIFPLTVRFLGTYQVSADVMNMLTLQSYIDTLIGMSFMMGVLFELPVVCWLMGRIGIINARLMSSYRRHAIVAILILAAVVTPTTDVFTLFVVALPIWVLYELSILVVRTSNL
ncbi:MAG: twin-arginine translocase subunit TatC [Prevotella sp.]|nr:twin-arginine translocase subunit TatC [Prevotella sp.]